MGKHLFSNVRVPIEEDNPSIYRDESRCINCGACKNVCKFNVGVYGFYDLEKTDNKAICINCGACAMVCPTRSICERKDYLEVKKIDNKVKIFITSPAVRVALGEEFDYELGTNVEKKLVSVLRKLGADYVFDTTFGADLTIMEEANELVDRIKNNKTMPMFTSCCPAWVKFVETFYPEFIPNLSTSKSPISMQAAIIKSYFANLIKVSREDIVTIAVTPCTAKKAEIKREEFNHDADYVVTTRELADWIREEDIKFRDLEDSEYDDIMNRGTGAGLIFGNSGGVMEAAVRLAYKIITNKAVDKKLLEFSEVRGLQNVKEATLDLGDMSLKLAIINGTGDARVVLEKIKNNELHYDFIEVMTCEGGCIAGGGQPRVHFPVTNEVKLARMRGLYKSDVDSKCRISDENEDIIRVYKEFLGAPLSEKQAYLPMCTTRTLSF